MTPLALGGSSPRGQVLRTSGQGREGLRAPGAQKPLLSPGEL
jgi:hypothetical protein